MDEARERKQNKYQDLVNAAADAGYIVELITLEVGSRGLIMDSELNDIQAALGTTRVEMNELALHLCKTAVLGSFKIWCCRNLHTC